jgi:hypothetical protein
VTMSDDEKNPARELITDYAQAHFRYFRTADGTVYAQRNDHPVARPMRSRGSTGKNSWSACSKTGAASSTGLHSRRHWT